MLSKLKFKHTIACLSVSLFLIAISFAFVKAETSGTSGESGVTSYLKTTYNSVLALGYGSDAAGAWGDWGAYWNRIRSAAEWVPSSNATASDVRAGKTFYSNSRSVLTGTYPAVSSCSTQQWYSGYASASKANNCGIDWVTADPAVEGDDKQDPRTGLVWSQALKVNGANVEFAASNVSAWTWDASGLNNDAVGGKTAIELCSERGSGWRLPSVKEGMQAYVDGAYWALTTVSNVNTWSTTETGNGTQARYYNFNTGYTSSTAFGQAYNVRCVR